MALGIDTTRAFRFQEEIVRLVNAVIAASSADESTWIEWKRTLDLNKETAFHHLPRHVLGFANREPADAAHNAEGYSYLIIGAEPGRVSGVAPIDPGDLSSRLRAYVGDKIIWHPQYLTIQGEQVLVIAVDPPRAGDPIHTLRKKMQNTDPGEIFIRLSGQTVKARPDHIVMLQNRFKASTNLLDISVVPWGASSIERVAELEPLTTPWVDETRKRLLEAFPKSPPEGAVKPGNIKIEIGGESLAERLERAAAAKRDKYEKDVEFYLNQWARAVRMRRDILQSEHTPSQFTLVVRNNTDRNFRALRVNVFISNVSSPDFESHDWPDLPSEPKLPTRSQELMVSTGGLLGHLTSTDEAAIQQAFMPHLTPELLTPSVKIDNVKRRLHKNHGPGGLLLEYPEIDVRPRQELLLESVSLEIRDNPGSTLSLQWDATAANSDGKLEGVIPILVTASTLRLSWMFHDDDMSEN